MIVPSEILLPSKSRTRVWPAIEPLQRANTTINPYCAPEMRVPTESAPATMFTT